MSKSKTETPKKKKGLDVPTRKRFTLVVFGFVVIGVAAGAVIYFFLWKYSSPDIGGSGRIYDLVRTAATILGVLTVGGAAAIQYRKQRFMETSAEIEWTMKFASLLTTAIEHLGEKSLSIQIGALYELKRLAVDSYKDRESIFEIIAYFIKEKSKAASKNPENESELQAAILVAKEILCILLREYRDETHNPNLSGVDLSAGNLSGADLRGIKLYEANLKWTNLIGAKLEGAILMRANLEQVYLGQAHLEGTHFISANLKGAHLEGTHLKGANLEWALLEGAHLEGASMSGTRVTAKQLIDAHISERTLLDENIREKLEALRKKRDAVEELVTK